MRIKLDENLPLGLADELANLGHDVDTTISEGLAGHTDSEVWQTALESDRFLITQDLDFSDIRQFNPSTHTGLLILRLRDPGRRSLLDRTLSLFSNEDITEWEGCLVIATDRKIRIRRPGA